MRKILVSLLVVSMLLGLVGTAFAGAFSDTAGNKYTDKVAAYGWMGGYPDGTFKPAGNITRAEVAAVLVRALGLSAAADAAKGIGSKFTDVPATHWAAGFVNVCTSKNIIKGYADGTFKPEANVTNAEIVTMIIRALNREALAVGDWPVGHITAAVDAGIIGTGFVSSALATRQDVATYVSKASTKDFYKLTTAGWEADNTKSFVKLNSFTKGASATLTAYTATTVTVGGVKSTLAAAFRVAGGATLNSLVGYKVFATTNEDDEVVLIEADTTYTVKTGKVDYKVGDTALYLKSDTTKYEMAPAYDVYINGVLNSSNVLTNVLTNKPTELHIADNLVKMIKIKNFDVNDKEVSAIYTSGTSTTWSLTANSITYSVASDAVILKNGAEVAFSAIKKYDIVDMATTGANVIKYLEATDKTVAGKVTATRKLSDVNGDTFFLSIDGVEYEGLSEAALSGAVTNNTVECTLAVGGEIFATEVTTASTPYAKIISFTTGAGSGAYDKWVVDIKGVATTYEVAKKANGIDSYHGDLVTAGCAIGEYVKLAFDANGRIASTTAKVNNYVAATADYIKVASVYAADKLVKISHIQGDNEDDLATNRATASSSYYSMGDTAIVYTNGTYTGTGAASVAAGSFVKFVLDTTGAKVEFMLVDDSTKYVAGKVTNDADSIDGLAGAVTGSTNPALCAKLYAYATADMSADPVATATATSTGTFELKWPGSNDAVGEVAYVKVVEPYGNYTTFTATRAIVGTAVSLTSLTENLTAAFSPAVANGTYIYTLAATNAEASVDITPTLVGATMYWNVNTDDVTGPTTVASGDTASIDLEVGANVIVLHVESDGRGVDYIITVTRAAN